MNAPLADQLLAMGMQDLDIGLVLARLGDEHYDLNDTCLLAEVLAPNRIQAIETFIWAHLRPSFRGKRFCLSPDFLKSNVDWGSAWRLLRQRHGMGCVQLPKESDQAMVRFLFVAGRNALSPNTPILDLDQADPHCSDQLIWGQPLKASAS